MRVNRMMLGHGEVPLLKTGTDFVNNEGSIVLAFSPVMLEP